MGFASFGIEDMDMFAACGIVIWISPVFHRGRSESDNGLRIRARDATGTQAGGTKIISPLNAMVWATRAIMKQIRAVNIMAAYVVQDLCLRAS